MDAKIDFFNAITALRALAQDKPNSFAYQLMSRKGTKRPKEILHLAKDGQLASWFNVNRVQVLVRQLARRAVKHHVKPTP